MALKDWKKWDENRYFNSKTGDTLILQEGSNVLIILKDNGKQQRTSPAPNRKKLEVYAKSYMRTH